MYPLSSILVLATRAQVSVEALKSDECLAVIQALCLAISVDIGAIEAKHSSNREVTMMRARGWYPSLQTLTAAFVTKCFSVLSGFLGLAGDLQESVSGTSKETKPSKEKTRGGGGGGWRAFVHERSAGVRFDGQSTSELAALWAELPAEEKARFQRAGQLATRAHAAGFQAFGPRRCSANQHAAVPELSIGDVTNSGAIVAADPASMLDSALTYGGQQTFETRFQRAKK